MKKHSITYLASVLTLVVSAATQAQQNEMQRCAAMEDSLERLVCYDNMAKNQQRQHGEDMQQRQQMGQQQQEMGKQQREMGQKRGKKQGQEGRQHGQHMAEQAREKGQTMRSERNHREDDDRQDNAERFGMEHKNADQQGKIEKLQVKVAERREDPYGNWIITLENGQVWKQTESVGYFRWQEDDDYYIERGALNSFFFGREGANRRFRVTRVE